MALGWMPASCIFLYFAEATVATEASAPPLPPPLPPPLLLSPLLFDDTDDSKGATFPDLSPLSLVSSSTIVQAPSKRLLLLPLLLLLLLRRRLPRKSSTCRTRFRSRSGANALYSDNVWSIAK
jgi:hypothetical protein